MKLVIISDTHSTYRDLILPGGDVLIHAGDIDTYHGESVFNDFNNWIESLDYKHKIVIAGNHDKYIFENPNCVKDAPYIYLENSGVTIEGVNFYGSPVSPKFGHWYFMRERGDESAKVWNKIPDNTDVLITHGPPYDILDETAFKSKVGCYDLLHKILKVQPKYHIFGHIHEAYGIKKKENTTFINASVVDFRYNLTNKPIEVKI